MQASSPCGGVARSHARGGVCSQGSLSHSVCSYCLGILDCERLGDLMVFLLSKSESCHVNDILTRQSELILKIFYRFKTPSTLYNSN